MPTRKVDVAVIGAGSAGLSALKQIRDKTSNFVLIDRGPLGTTCARVGCMPSKVFLQAAKDFHRRDLLDVQGIGGGQGLSVDVPRVLARVRELRDFFVGFVLESVEGYGDRVLHGEARFVAPHTLQVGDEVIEAGAIVLATGSRPVLPEAWAPLGKKVVTTDGFFELEDLPGRIAVIGMGVIGTELGQGIARLGKEVVAVGRGAQLAGISDPKVGEVAAQVMGEEMKLVLGERAELSDSGSGVKLTAGGQSWEVDLVLASLGRAPNLDRLDLTAGGIQVNERGIPRYDRTTQKVEGHRVFIAGDVDGYRPILHEASDEGTIAGHNAVATEPECFVRRAPIGVTFSDPNVFFAGQRFEELPDHAVMGEVDYSGQGRARIKQENKGWLRVYGDPESGRLLGAEGVCPDGEHLAHLLAWSIQRNDSVSQMLQYPFYHPVIEEGLRTALRDLCGKMDTASCSRPEVAFCSSEAPDGMG